MKLFVLFIILSQFLFAENIYFKDFKYPILARQAGIEGDVVVNISIKNGVVRSKKTKKSNDLLANSIVNFFKIERSTNRIPDGQYIIHAKFYLKKKVGDDNTEVLESMKKNKRRN
jgi:hypothetical protein